jgi:hypothetical protein
LSCLASKRSCSDSRLRFLRKGEYQPLIAADPRSCDVPQAVRAVVVAIPQRFADGGDVRGGGDSAGASSKETSDISERVGPGLPICAKP